MEILYTSNAGKSFNRKFTAKLIYFMLKITDADIKLV